MSEFLEDPSILTKDKLKSELLANNVSLPSGEHRKDVYVQLYLKTLTVQNKKKSPPDTFSSDEELPPPVVSNKSRSGRKATRKTDKSPADEVDVADLTDESLKEQLLKYGFSVGPIVASTRKLYERKLQKLMEQGPPEATPPPAAPAKIDSNQNGNTDSDQYSDKEEEIRHLPVPDPEPEPEPEPEPIPVVEKPVRSRGKTPQRTRRQDHNRQDFPEVPAPKPLNPAPKPLTPTPLRNGSKVAKRESVQDVPDVPAPTPVTPSPRPITATPLGKGSELGKQVSVVEERLVASDQVSVVGEKDVLKEIFPNEPCTPTGISATCRRPIRGAAGRPFTASDFWLDESRRRRSERIETSTSFIESRTTARAAAPLLSASSYSSTSSFSSAAAPSTSMARPRRSLPVWVQLLLLSAVAGFLFFVYQTMEANETNPFIGSEKQDGAGQ